MENKKSFEEISVRISEIVALLENTSTSLDQSLALFEEGVGLIKQANEILDDAEKKVKMLTEAEIK